ncbi:Hypothetical predicted protein [Mytilus galloprovincialis]|uniref:Reverse transcriptase domain-containing protein n=1 Tax=Mytilus galloprovincialis TaxID=29158 RepID=A0A8B6DEP4_MYTGA|nr:Hypothetical predicted protein [Mytilus galloprovincialis]
MKLDIDIGEVPRDEIRKAILRQQQEQPAEQNHLNKTTRLNETTQSISLTINEKKTKLMDISRNTVQPVYFGNDIIEEVGEFTYLGCMLSNTNGTAKDIRARISKARYAFC